ncbi:hypothetical protein PUN28_014514 [Cardiocondyla obscurior]|uniref:Odorant receptor n=1 Tax=Cardiocondyla obscurior TaxID=286306 RepID=A0AAW2F6D0_9HYME
MIDLKSRFSLNRILLLAIGMWPYTKSKLVQFQSTVYYGILGSFIMFQLTAFTTSEYDLHLIIEILSSTSFFSNFIITLTTFLLNIDIVKYLLELIQCTHDELRDEGEIAIIEKYWKIGKFYTQGLTCIGIFCVTSFILSPYLPYVIDIVFPINTVNESQLRPSLEIVTEYFFFDQKKYFYLIVLHANVSFCIGILVSIGTGTLLIVYMQHVCGMLKIASYRIDQIMAIGIKQMSTAKGASLIHKSIFYAVDMHRKALKYDILKIYAPLKILSKYCATVNSIFPHRTIKVFISAFNITFLILILDGLFYASLHLYLIFQELLTGHIGEKMIQSFIMLNYYYMYTFLANDMVQKIMDHNNDVFVAVYNVKWYLAPLHIQKLILFLLQRGTKAVHIYIGGLFMGSLEGFATLASASMSYFTFIYYANQ